MSAFQSLKRAYNAVTCLCERFLPGGLMENTVFGRVHLMFFMAIVMGPIVAGFSWQNQKRVDDVLMRGTVAEAIVTSYKATHGKGTTYSLDIVWRDTQGAERRVEGFVVSGGFYNRVTSSRQPAKIRIAYLAEETTSARRTVAPYDHARNADGAGLMRMFLLMGLVGVIGTAIMTLWRNRRLRRERLARVLTV